jgi:endonuclease/exonuclease/phosphatase family metal-dependent hydrolase
LLLPLKVTTWNIEHSNRLVSENPSAAVISRRQRVRETIESINPDILCIQEGPEGEKGIDDFSKQVLNQRWIPVLLRKEGEPLGQRDDEYNIAGTQWIWFLTKPELVENCRLQPPAVWKAFTKMETWTVHFWGKEKSSRHSHYRHPQVLIYDIGNGQEIELIGVHLKSKINKKAVIRDENEELIGDYVTEAMKARVKLATEACNIRQYISAKFEQVENPGILVMGDCNDGPGKDIFEDQYLFFDLISNLQGDVMIAERFFNHALFDFAGHLRWTAKYRDEVSLPPIPASKNPLLLDHILISQPLCRKNLSLEVNENAGAVEHEAYERSNAGAKSNTITSDHRPVTLKLDDAT